MGTHTISLPVLADAADAAAAALKPGGRVVIERRPGTAEARRARRSAVRESLRLKRRGRAKIVCVPISRVRPNFPDEHQLARPRGRDGSPVAGGLGYPGREDVLAGDVLGDGQFSRKGIQSVEWKRCAYLFSRPCFPVCKRPVVKRRRLACLAYTAMKGAPVRRSSVAGFETEALPQAAEDRLVGGRRHATAKTLSFQDEGFDDLSTV